MSTLSGIRVIDFSKVLAGPLCTQYLGDMGAEVIKVETVKGGDDTRRWPPFHGDKGTVFLSANRNKQSVALDLKTSEGLEIAHRLIKTADVVVESFGPGVTSRLKIDYETVKNINPDIVYCSISGFGRTGPLKNAKGYDVILQAFSGMMAITGEPDGAPVRSPFSPIDQATGMHAAIGILAAIIKRMKTGQGTLIEASLFDTSIGFLGYVAQSFWERRSEPRRWGSAHESLCPYQVFDAEDRPFLLGVANDSLWQAFCRATAAPELARDARFMTNADRVEHRAETLAEVQRILLQHPRDYWLEHLTNAGIPCASIQEIGEMLSHPHTRESGIIQEFTQGEGAPINVVAQPLRFNGERNALRYPPPALGQHTKEILLGLGYGAADIDAFVQNGSVQASAQ
ncbi:CoA transferase [Paralcaligenes sp. KSB-10]|uniref:CaiB/BaiF CoA transferase family protein n=1 Tax=Paralcaligenes sp. KSB-10 TaxID=2901142 RepID=UPI001E398F93|nr:CoA transferase [Paralcaligenes sp. KSB-10]UHL65630.1 CoA transferase [Paralcaligenes sp. KSB-10]